MGFFDILFGEKPSTTTQTLSTLTPEQEAALNRLLTDLTKSRGAAFTGDVNVPGSELQNLSLAGLEERALQLADPNFQSNLDAQTIETLERLLNIEGATAEGEEFFRTNIRDPALAEFEETILPRIGREFGGTNFFGSERRSADETAREDLIDALTRSRTDIQFRTRESALDRALQALGLVPSVDPATRRTDELLALFGAGQAETGLAERNIEREFQRFIAEESLEDEDILNLLRGIGIQGQENVVTTSAGSAGLIPAMLVAMAGGGSFDSLIPGGKGSTAIGGGGTRIGGSSKPLGRVGSGNI